MDHAATTMQLLARMVINIACIIDSASVLCYYQFVSKVRVKRRRQQLKEELEARDDASVKIKVFLLTRMRRFKSKLTGDAFRMYVSDVCFHDRFYNIFFRIVSLWCDMVWTPVAFKLLYGIRFYRRKWAAITEVQRLFRGFTARERVFKIKIDLSARHFAATIIQKYFRLAFQSFLLLPIDLVRKCLVYQGISCTSLERYEAKCHRSVCVGSAVSRTQR